MTYRPTDRRDRHRRHHATQTYTTPGQNGTLTFSATAGQRISLMAGGGSTTAQNVTVSIKSPTNAIVLAATPVGTTGCSSARSR